VKTSTDHGKKVERKLSKVAGDLKRVRQDLCIAYKSQTAGLEHYKVTEKQFVMSLEASGIPCKLFDVGNARKNRFEPHQTLRTERVITALNQLKTGHFPNLQIELLLEVDTDHQQTEYSHAA